MPARPKPPKESPQNGLMGFQKKINAFVVWALRKVGDERIHDSTQHIGTARFHEVVRLDSHCIIVLLAIS